MTKEQVIAWARQAGGVQLFTPAEFGAHAKTKTDTHISMTTDALERFATLVRNATLTEAMQTCKLALDAHAIRNLKDKT